MDAHTPWPWPAISYQEASRYTSHPHQTFQSINQYVMSMLMQTRHGHGLQSIIQKPAPLPVTIPTRSSIISVDANTFCGLRWVLLMLAPLPVTLPVGFFNLPPPTRSSIISVVANTLCGLRWALLKPAPLPVTLPVGFFNLPPPTRSSIISVVAKQFSPN